MNSEAGSILSHADAAKERDEIYLTDKAINEALEIARSNGIAGYAIEIMGGWTTSGRKPSLRYGKVFEVHFDGGVYPT